MTLALADGNKQIARYLLLANTPLFIVRNLKNNYAIIEFAAKKTPEELEEGFNNAISRDPSSIYEEIDPYVYAVAMHIKQRTHKIRYPILNHDITKYKWMKEILSYLDKSALPAQEIFLTFPAQPPSISDITRG